MKREPNYRGMFIIGISMIALGTSFLSIDRIRPTSIVFITVGGLFLIISLKNKDKWSDDKFEK